jgi:hypothetical protein
MWIHNDDRVDMAAAAGEDGKVPKSLVGHMIYPRWILTEGQKSKRDLEESSHTDPDASNDDITNRRARIDDDLDAFRGDWTNLVPCRKPPSLPYQQRKVTSEGGRNEWNKGVCEYRN